MDTQSEQLLERLFHEVTARDAEARQEYLAQVRAAHPEHFEELMALLEVDARATDDLRSPMMSGRDVAPTDHLPAAIGPYRVLELIGQGGMGTVYLAQQDVPVRRQVAIKVMNARVSNRSLEARFSAERQACALMEHDGIAKMLDAGDTEDGLPYYVMELVSGASITAYCERHGLGLEARIELMIATCHALQHAHQRGVIHRDLKPANVLVTESDDGRSHGAAQPKVIDFGVAKSLHLTRDEASLETLDGSLVGTPEYMSPEQAGGNTTELDTRSDVYSLGVILYELSVGRRPFHGHAAVLRAIREEEPLLPSRALAKRLEEQSSRDQLRVVREERWLQSLRQDLDWILMRALAKAPEERYQSASELAADLRRFLRQEPVEAGPPSALYRVRKFARRQRGLVLGACIALLALIAGFVASLWQAGRAERSLADYRRMSDVHRARELLRQADGELWPIRERSLALYRTWLERADALVRRRALHEERLQALNAQLARLDRDAGANRDPAELEWELKILRELLANLDALSQPCETSVQRREATIASVRWRQERAMSMRAETVDAHRALWERARRGIASAGGSYQGLEIEAQPGLVPLGENPATGLWEFWHTLSGARPDWQGGRCELGEESGLVLVLVPGGSFHMGAAKPPGGRGYGPNLDPHSGHVSVPVHEVTLAPFFLSRFELTQGQWRRWTGESPSRLQAPTAVRGHVTTWTHPVERVSWESCRRTVIQLGLELPTEAQWEYACRAGTRSVFSSGNAIRTILGEANLADEASRGFLAPPWDYDRASDDGYALHAPVGRFRPNAWGFYDMHGNVNEWCLDAYASYDNAVRSGDGLRTGGSPADGRVLRGGAFYLRAKNARSAERHRHHGGHRSGFSGLRPARRIVIR